MSLGPISPRLGSVRTGVVGGGFMGVTHSRAIRNAGGHLVSVATSSPAGGRRAADELAADRFDSDAAALIAAKDIDAVHICTPNATHAEYARAALRAGKHVVCEKPLATTSRDAAQLLTEAQAAGVVAAVPFVYRYHPMVREARERVANGAFGALLSLDGVYLQDWLLDGQDDDWRVDPASGGSSRAFADIGSHLCDLIEFVAGERIVRLTARTRTVHPERGGRPVSTEDVAAVLIETGSGAVGTLLVSQTAPGRKNALTIELHGSEETIRFEQERPEELWLGRRSDSRLLLRDPASATAASARLQVLPAGHPLGYQDAFTAFVADVHAAIRGLPVDGLPTFADGLRAVVLTEAVLESAASGAWVDVAA